jgi:hypothetical protein
VQWAELVLEVVEDCVDARRIDQTALDEERLQRLRTKRPGVVVRMIVVVTDMVGTGFVVVGVHARSRWGSKMSTCTV